MNEQTKKLEGILYDYGFRTKLHRSAIKRACKEAGLKFVFDIQAPCFGKQWAKFEDIDLT